MERLLIQGGHEYLPFARSRIRALKALGMRYVSQTYVVNGVTINVSLENGTEYIRITGGGVYLESGIQDLRNVLPAFEETYRPAQVLFTPRVAALSGSGKGKLPNAFGRALSSGDISWSATGGKQNTLTDSATVYIGSSGAPIVFRSDEKVYCPDPAATYNAKRASLLIPPSVFTGKLSLYVQALYGSSRRDYRAIASTNGVSQLLGVETGETYIDASGEVKKIYHYLTSTMPTSGLMTHISKEGRRTYLLITIENKGVAFTRMKGSRGSVMSKDFPQESEAYILANLVPAAAGKAADGPDLSEVAKGNPIAYGWHFNEDGTSASIVMTEGKDISGVKAYDASPATIRGMRNTLYTMTLTYTPETDSEEESMTYSIGAIASGDHIPYLQTNVFTPGLYGGMELITPGGPEPWNCYASLGPTPIYCYYNNSDSLSIVNVTNAGLEIVPVESTMSSPTDPVAIFGTDNVVLSSARQTSSGGGFRFSNFGVSSNDFSYVGSDEIFTGGGSVADFLITGGGATVTIDADGNTVSYIDNAKSFYVVRSLDSSSAGYKPVLIIPFGDASAVIAGERKNQVFGDVLSQTTYNFANNSAYSSSKPSLNPVKWGGPYTGAMLWNQATPGLTKEQALELFPLPQGTTEFRSLSLYSKAGVTKLKEFASSSASPNPDDPIYTGLFFAGPNADTYPASMTVRSSYFGELMHSNTMGEIEDNPVGGWPIGGTTPTGWA